MPPTAPPPEWIVRSNRNAGILLDVLTRFHPESAGMYGASGVDEDIIDLTVGFVDRHKEALRQAISLLTEKLTEEENPHVRQDLEIMLKAAADDILGLELSEKYEIPYFNMPELVFNGLRALLDDQVAPERRQAALVRLKKYAGVEPGYRPITALAEEYIRERLHTPGLLGPYRGEVEKNLARSSFLVDGIGHLFQRYGIEGYEENLDLLKRHLLAHQDFIRREILPRCREDFRLPPEMYAFRLEEIGVDIPPAELARLARAAFVEIQAQMEQLAPRVAAAKGFDAHGYREVIAHLRAEQIGPDEILNLYRSRAGIIEEIIRCHDLVTLPDRPMRIRLATAAESASIPAPHMRPPRLIGNTGEMGEFVLPYTIPMEEGGELKTELTDFTFDAISWMLTAHEGRPGHELQFDRMVEEGVSVARALFAFNSVNAEGWALYAETVMQPYMPLEGQLMALQFQLVRAARAFLDPELQLGLITPQEAHRILRDDVCLTPLFAQEEVDRYTFFLPGQATSYFYGYRKLMELRAQTEKILGPAFNLRRFHDFILSQGLLPPDLLRNAVMAEFVTTTSTPSCTETPTHVC